MRKLNKSFRGEFIGTDYNYLYSDDLKKLVEENCLEHNLQMMNLENYQEPLHQDWHAILDRNGNDVMFQNDIQEIIQSAFVHSNRFYLNGAFACVYFISAISTFLSGLSTYFNR